MFNFDINGIKLSVNDATESLDNWTVKKSEVVMYYKEEVIVKSFQAAFPHISLLGDSYEDKFQFIGGLVSRNDKLLEWFSLEKLKYSDLAQLPSYLKDLIEPKKFSELQEKVSNVNRTISYYSARRSVAAKEYQQKLKDIDNEMILKVNSIKGEDKIIKVLTLTSQSLPLSMAAALERYNTNSSDADFADKKKLYVRELLTNFKVSLLKLIKEDPDIDIDLIISELSLK
jgi:hypothetical protein